MSFELKNEINSQLKWLSSLIKIDGLFLLTDKSSNKKYRIVPYFSNIACLALIEHEDYIEQVKKYMFWYINHLNYPDKYNIYGTIYDYTADENMNVISNNDYDSYDSYPATFLTLCNKYFEITNDKSFFVENIDKIYLITKSLLSTMDNDYLTWAKPNYKIKYLMDNCEVCKGLKDAEKIFKNIYSDINFSEKLNKFINNSNNSIQSKMFNSNGFYYYMIDNSGKAYSPNFSKWYPDMSSQLFPFLNEVINPYEFISINIYNQFEVNYPTWFNGINGSDSPNVYVAYVAFLMKDFNNSLKYLDYCISKYTTSNNWPWNSFESSYFIRTASKLISYT